ncbi:MAG: transcriptional repressor [Actinomycetota bacterium]|nr:transcriptional repressor [Actinomycetota bacterium]
MTQSPDVPPVAVDDLPTAVRLLRERGLRLSTARRLVLQALLAADAPLPAERVANALSLDLTSVYRNLETLEQCGLVRHVHLGHGPGLYTLVGRGEHEYLVCERCGAVRVAAPGELDDVRERIRRSFGYEVHFAHFAMLGKCRDCAIDQ